MVFFIPVQRSQQLSSACPWLHAGPATKRHCGSPPPKRGRDLISPRPSEHRLLQLRHLGCCECNQTMRPGRSNCCRQMIWIWNDRKMCWHMHSMKLRQVISLPGSEKLRFTIILYSTIISFIYNLFQGAGLGLLIFHTEQLPNIFYHMLPCKATYVKEKAGTFESWHW